MDMKSLCAVLYYYISPLFEYKISVLVDISPSSLSIPRSPHPSGTRYHFPKTATNAELTPHFDARRPPRCAA